MVYVIEREPVGFVSSPACGDERIDTESCGSFLKCLSAGLTLPKAPGVGALQPARASLAPSVSMATVVALPRSVSFWHVMTHCPAVKTSDEARCPSRDQHHSAFRKSEKRFASVGHPKRCLKLSK